MPKSRRQKPLPNTKLTKKGKYNKELLVNKIHQYCDTYKYIFVFECIHMRNNSLKQLRIELNEHSKFVLGKSTVMRYALGQDEQNAYKQNIDELTRYVTGQRGLLFTNDSIDSIVEQFSSYNVPNYARAGTVCTEAFTLSQGELPSDIITFSMEPQLRKLGLPTQLKNGIVTLLNDVTVCNVGDILTPEQCKILELFEMKQAQFRINLLAVYDGENVRELEQPVDDNSAEMDDVDEIET